MKIINIILASRCSRSPALCHFARLKRSPSSPRYEKLDEAHLFVGGSPYRSLARWALLALLVTSMPAFAQTTIWVDATGDWFTAANWSAGVPDSGTTAQINNGGTAQIMATDAAASEVDLGVAAGDVGTLSVSGGGTLGPMNIGESGTGTLNITGGGVLSSGDSVLGTFSGSGTVTVNGRGSTWTISGDLSVGSGSGGIGMVTINEGGQVTSDNGFIGNGSASNGTVTVAGGNAAWNNSGNVYVGGDASGAVGTGELHLLNAATVRAASVTVWSTGFLTGNGFVEAGVANDGTLAPNPIISITGDLSFDPAAIMSTTVMPAIADEVMVAGIAGLDGNLDVTLTGGPFIVGMQYTLLTATGGLNGTTFANVSITAPAGVTAQATYDTNDVFLTIESAPSPTPTPTGTVSPTPTATTSPTPTPTVTISPTPTATATTTPSATPRQTPTPRIGPTPRPRPTPPPRP
jgi:T5SS/PEP-CTERM-associated repeat protein